MLRFLVSSTVLCYEVITTSVLAKALRVMGLHVFVFE